MILRPRVYDNILAAHLAKNRQMAFVSGPRQVGKTTSCHGQADLYLNYDSLPDRKVILAGEGGILGRLPLRLKHPGLPVVLFDELHKLHKWKNFLKGIFDSNEKRFKILVTGSSRLDAYRHAGDALTGRYFSYRMHPFSVGEIARQAPSKRPAQDPLAIPENEYKALWEHGGFPEPFLRRERAHTLQWAQKRHESLAREDIRELTRVAQLSTVENLALMLQERSARQLSLSSLATALGVSPHTVKAWVDILANLHWGFQLRPFSRNVARSLVKEPKWYLRDWSGIEDPGARAETFVACQLLKAVEGWTDLGLGQFSLHYVRDKAGREVDFLVASGGKPWALVEVKSRRDVLSPTLAHFQKVFKVDHALQVVADLPFQDVDCFSIHRPAVVPARTFLSQLL
jgi:predicted AAA+ superfamily ATPase